MKKAKDSTSPLVYLAALYGLWKFLRSKDKEIGFYDFSKYQR
jgi:hypothetical protein